MDGRRDQVDVGGRSGFIASETDHGACAEQIRAARETQAGLVAVSRVNAGRHGAPHTVAQQGTAAVDVGGWLGGGGGVDAAGG